MTITAGQLLSAINGLEQMGVDVGPELNLENLSQDAVIGEDVLSVVAVFWPPAALLAEALAIAVVLEPLIAAAGFHIAPDTLPMTDAQTTQSRGGRNG